MCVCGGGGTESLGAAKGELAATSGHTQGLLLWPLTCPSPAWPLTCPSPAVATDVPLAYSAPPQKFEIARLGWEYVMKRPREAPPRAPVRGRGASPLQLLDYRCHVPDGVMGTAYPPEVRCDGGGRGGDGEGGWKCVWVRGRQPARCSL